MTAVSILARLSCGVALTLFVAATGAQTLVWRDQDAIGWACGGIGFEERQALRGFESRGNVALLFVTGARGALVADIALRVVSTADAARGLEIVADGPQCVLRLPAGEWRITARFGQTTLERRISVRSAEPAALHRVQLSFPPEGGDLRASPDESSQVGDWGKVGR
ncbi:MAG: hypothetical protein ACKODB_15050 [Betaproteobacteria bacterium]